MMLMRDEIMVPSMHVSWLLRGSVEPILGRILDFKCRRLTLAAFRRAPAGGVDSIDLLDISDRLGGICIRRRLDHGELQPGHGRSAVRSGCGACGSGGVGDAFGKVDAVVGLRGAEVERRGGKVREVVVSRQG